jgi:hypothetical protein
MFDPRFLSLNGTPASPDSLAKAVLTIDLNWRSNSIRIDAEIERSRIFFLLENAKIKIFFYCHGAGKITYDLFYRLLL